MVTALPDRPDDDGDIVELDHIEFWVGNPKQAAHFYRSTFGLMPTGYAGLETGVRERSSYIVSSGDVRFVLSGAVAPDGPIARFVNTHGDGVYDIAFRVNDVDRVFHRALRHGAKPVSEPALLEYRDKSLKHASVKAFGDVIHSFIERTTDEWFLPGFVEYRPPDRQRACVTSVDHIAVGLPYGFLSEQAAFYEGALGFRESQQEYVVTDRSSMNSKVMESHAGTIKLPLVEAVPGKYRSQVEEYLEFNHGPGVQHAALSSQDIVGTVATLRHGGIEFLQTPGAYYELLQARVGDLEEELQTLREHDILVDKDRWGYLMQIFSKPLQARPTFFVEIIQRKGARGFGSGNIKALFEAVEREQSRRGNL